MNNQSHICFTLEAALEYAVEMENGILQEEHLHWMVQAALEEIQAGHFTVLLLVVVLA